MKDTGRKANQVPQRQYSCPAYRLRRLHSVAPELLNQSLLWKAGTIAAFPWSVSPCIFHTPNRSQRPFFSALEKRNSFIIAESGKFMSWHITDSEIVLFVSSFLKKPLKPRLWPHSFSILRCLNAGKLKRLSLLLKVWATGRFCAAQPPGAVSCSEPCSVPEAWLCIYLQVYFVRPQQRKFGWRKLNICRVCDSVVLPHSKPLSSPLNLQGGILSRIVWCSAHG